MKFDNKVGSDYYDSTAVTRINDDGFLKIHELFGIYFKPNITKCDKNHRAVSHIK